MHNKLWYIYTCDILRRTEHIRTVGTLRTFQSSRESVMKKPSERLLCILWCYEKNEENYCFDWRGFFNSSQNVIVFFFQLDVWGSLCRIMYDTQRLFSHSSALIKSFPSCDQHTLYRQKKWIPILLLLRDECPRIAQYLIYDKIWSESNLGLFSLVMLMTTMACPSNPLEETYFSLL